jgi:hypothetical protein
LNSRPLDAQSSRGRPRPSPPIQKRWSEGVRRPPPSAQGALRPLVRLSVRLSNLAPSKAASRATRGRRSAPLTPPAGPAPPRPRMEPSIGPRPMLARRALLPRRAQHEPASGRPDHLLPRPDPLPNGDRNPKYGRFRGCRSRAQSRHSRAPFPQRFPVPKHQLLGFRDRKSRRLRRSDVPFVRWSGRRQLRHHDRRVHPARAALRPPSVQIPAEWQNECLLAVAQERVGRGRRRGRAAQWTAPPRGRICRPAGTASAPQTFRE